MSASAIVLIERSSLARCDRSRLTSQNRSDVVCDLAVLDLVRFAVVPLIVLIIHRT
jgi:hypothetical protein